jgi:hypothetical protein
MVSAMVSERKFTLNLIPHLLFNCMAPLLLLIDLHPILLAML